MQELAEREEVERRSNASSDRGEDASLADRSIC